MTDETATAPHEQSSDPGADQADRPARPSIAVPLEFELATIESSLAELAAIEPGYVFDLPLPLDHALVAIRCNGKRIGRGELVAIGDTLGVRLVDWAGDRD